MSRVQLISVFGGVDAVEDGFYPVVEVWDHVAMAGRTMRLRTEPLERYQDAYEVSTTIGRHLDAVARLVEETLKRERFGIPSNDV